MQALEARLKDLAKAFEEATIDKSDQETKMDRINKVLLTAAQLKKVKT